jgi:hypothetical protein
VADEMTTPAPKGQVYVCAGCFRTSRTRAGWDGAGDPGWDESCFLNAVLCYEGKAPDGSWVAVDAVNRD